MVINHVCFHYQVQGLCLVLFRGVPSKTLIHNRSPALLPEQPSHLLSTGTPCPSSQLLALFLGAERFPVAQSASPWHIRQRCILPARAAHSASSVTDVTSAPSTSTTTLPGGRRDAGIGVQRALGGADGGVAGGDKCTWRREGVLGGLTGVRLRFWLRVVPGTGSSKRGGWCRRGQGQVLRWLWRLGVLCRMWRRLRLVLFQGKVAALHTYFAPSAHGATIWNKNTVWLMWNNEKQAHYGMFKNAYAPFLVLTVLSCDTGVRLALAQLAETGGTAAAGDGGPAPAALLLPQCCTAHWDALGTGNAAGQARDAAAAAAAAAGHCHLGWAWLLGRSEGWEEWIGRGEGIMGGKVTQRLQQGIWEGRRSKEKLNTK